MQTATITNLHGKQEEVMFEAQGTMVLVVYVNRSTNMRQTIGAHMFWYGLDAQIIVPSFI